jgi:hypothetical protein
MPGKVPLRPWMPPMENQQTFGTCVDNAVVGMGECFLTVAGVGLVDLSRMMSAYNGHALLGKPFLTSDQGSTLRAALRAANKIGICKEETYPYTAENFNAQPPATAYVEAADYRLGAYYRIPKSEAVFGIRYALAMGFPVLVATLVGQQLFTLQPGEIYTGVGWGNTPAGGHAYIIDGYDATSPDGKLIFDIRNSWGVEWCDSGYGLMDSSVINMDLMDAWVCVDFAGVHSVGPNRVGTSLLNSKWSVEDIVTDVFLRKFGRAPKQAGMDFWAEATLDYIGPHIIAAASTEDKQYMDAHST